MDTNVKEMFLKLKDEWQIKLWNEYCQRGDINDFKEYTIYKNDVTFFDMLADENDGLDLDFVMFIARCVYYSGAEYHPDHKYISYTEDECDGDIKLFTSNKPSDLMYQDADGLDSGFIEYLTDKYFA